jgi:hypothetical protein
MLIVFGKELRAAVEVSLIVGVECHKNNTVPFDELFDEEDVPQKEEDKKEYTTILTGTGQYGHRFTVDETFEEVMDKINGNPLPDGLT